jgi:hypothetical protein
MNIVSAQSAHWTDEQLIDYLYGIGPNDGHLNQCESCFARLSAMQTRRKRVSLPEAPVSEQFLAAQRRSIYGRLSEPRPWWRDLRFIALPGRRLAAATALVVVLGGSLTLYENHRRELAEARSDAQLAQDVSQMSFESEPQATAPLHGLFIE